MVSIQTRRKHEYMVIEIKTMAEFIVAKVLVEKFIKGHVPTFAFKSNDMPGICSRMMNYKLNMDLNLLLV